MAVFEAVLHEAFAHELWLRAAFESGLDGDVDEGG